MQGGSVRLSLAGAGEVSGTAPQAAGVISRRQPGSREGTFSSEAARTPLTISHVPHLHGWGRLRVGSEGVGQQWGQAAAARCSPAWVSGGFAHPQSQKACGKLPSTSPITTANVAQFLITQFLDNSYASILSRVPRGQPDFPASSRSRFSPTPPDRSFPSPGRSSARRLRSSSRRPTWSSFSAAPSSRAR